MRRRWIVGLVIAAAAGIGIRLLRPEATQVDIAIVGRQAVEAVLEERATLRAAVHDEITAPSAGRLVPAPLEPGAAVEPTTEIARLHPAPLDARMRTEAADRLAATVALAAAARGQVAQARVTLLEASRARRRAVALGGSGGLSAQAIEQTYAAETLAARAVEVAVARARAAEADARLARAALHEGAPILLNAGLRGTLLRRFEEHPRTVAAGTPVAEVGDLASLEVHAEVRSEEVGRIALGMPIRVFVGRDTVSGVVARIEPTAFTKVSALGVEEQRVRVIGRLDRVPTGVGHGWEASLMVVLDRRPSAASVARSALVEERDGWWTFVVRGGRAERRTVRIGLVGAGAAEVLDGLSVGDTVIRYPSGTLVDGRRVRPVTTAPPP